MLNDFILANREEIIERARRRVSARSAPKSTDTRLEHGIPIFLTQLVSALEQASAVPRLHLVGEADTTKRITDTATLHGRELLKNGLTVAQVVNGYGDVCQVITDLALETQATISVQDFHVFNGCLDDAIAGAVTAFGGQREDELVYEGTERLGVLVHELRNLLQTALLSLSIIKEGRVGIDGSTGAMLTRSLSGLSALIDRALAEVQHRAGTPKLERISLAQFIREIEISGAQQAKEYGLQLTVAPVDGDVVVAADSQLLASAVSNLLQNACKFSKKGGHVSLTTRLSDDHVWIEVGDECGGLPPGKTEELFRPFQRGGAVRAGLGLGLTIALSAARANSGDIRVRDIPGKGCVFSLELPRQPPSRRAARRPPRFTAS